jgi:hypothetical protein
MDAAIWTKEFLPRKDTRFNGSCGPVLDKRYISHAISCLALLWPGPGKARKLSVSPPPFPGDVNNYNNS